VLERVGYVTGYVHSARWAHQHLVQGCANALGGPPVVGYIMYEGVE
jgi:hypothetical protein